MLTSAIIIALYSWAFFAGVKEVGSSLLVPDVAAIIAAVTFVLSFIFYLWAPQKIITPSAIVVYCLMIVATATLVLSTGKTHSPFISLWMVTGFLSGIFGTGAIAVLLGIETIYLIYAVIAESAGRVDIITLSLINIVPLVISYLVWIGRNKKNISAEEHVKQEKSSKGRNESQSDVVFESIGDGVMVLAQNGAISKINPSAEDMLGWKKEDAVGLSYLSVLKLENEKGETINEQSNLIGQSLNTGEQLRDNHLTIISKTGKKISASIAVSPIEHVGEGVIVIFRDITKERAEERQQTEFISTASHEMRTPVASIEGYLGLALNPNTATIDEKARTYINKAHESAQHLGRLFQDLLDVTKAEDGRLKSTPEVIEAVGFTRDITDALRPKADEKNLEVRFLPDGAGSKDVVAPIVYIHADKDHLREVISNLVENAIKYTLKGTVSVDVTGTEEKVRIHIQDSGIGIPAEDIGHLFQKFYRVDNSDTREIGGTGLGLYLCRRLVESMQGRIWVESEYRKGSTFFVELPRISRLDADKLIAEDTVRKQEREAHEAQQAAADHLRFDKMKTAAEEAAKQASQQPAPAPSQTIAQATTPYAQPQTAPPAQSQTPQIQTVQPSQIQPPTFQQMQPTAQQTQTAPPIPTPQTQTATSTPPSATAPTNPPTTTPQPHISTAQPPPQQQNIQQPNRATQPRFGAVAYRPTTISQSRVNTPLSEIEKNRGQ